MKMGKLFKWRFSDRLPVSFQGSLVFFSLVLILSTVGFSMLPKSTWGDKYFGTLVLDVTTYVTNLKNSSDGSHAPAPYVFAEGFPFFAGAPSIQQLDGMILMPKDENVSTLKKAFAAVPPSSHIVEDVWPPNSTESHNHSALSPGNLTTTNDTNTVSTSDPLPSPPKELPIPEERTREKFLAPLLSYQVGAGNQFMEFISAAVIARSLNRTLCLSPFFPGPSRHTGQVRTGLAWEDRYDVLSLSKFTRVATWEHCLKECDYTLDVKWMLKSSREPKIQGWKKYPSNQDSWNLNWDYVRWTTPEDIFAALGSHKDRCVGMLGLFPGLRWRGAFLAVSAFLRPAPRINHLADRVQESILGKGTPYLAVHWRFEESECGPHKVGLCFVRCADGSVIDTGLRPEAREWHEAAETQCNRDRHFRGVALHKKDIIDAIQERAANHSVNTIYLATDGWMRGPQAIELLKEVVETLRKQKLTVVGLWNVPGLPNFADGSHFDPVITFGKANQDLNGAQISLVEQELCSRALTFMGSGQSTWSLSVFRVRLARRRVKQITEAAAELEASSVNLKDSKAVDELIAQTLLKDAHPAGLHCRYMRFMKRAIVKETVETYADEYPDGWLDLEACEGRIGHGGRCQVAKCF